MRRRSRRVPQADLGRSRRFEGILTIAADSIPGLLDRLAANRHTPIATYRLQFNRNFTFEDARRKLAYLHTLGVSDVYASPYLKAAPGSMHGYDIVDHCQLNPEIG